MCRFLGPQSALPRAGLKPSSQEHPKGPAPSAAVYAVLLAFNIKVPVPSTAEDVILELVIALAIIGMLV